jgi:hypothetical protein
MLGSPLRNAAQIITMPRMTTSIKPAKIPNMINNVFRVPDI